MYGVAVRCRLEAGGCRLEAVLGCTYFQAQASSFINIEIYHLIINIQVLQ